MGKVIKLNVQKKEKDELLEEDKERGSVAWQRLKSKNQPRLKTSDRVTIAENLAEAIKARGLDELALAKKIWIDSDEQSRGKYRYLLPKNLSPEKRVKRIKNLAANKLFYRRFIEEILKATPGEDRNLLIDTITYGTSLHPTEANLSEAEELFSVLQMYVRKLNEQHDLFARYRSIRDEHEQLIDLQGLLPHYGYIPIADVEHGLIQANNWREIIPFFPHVYLGVVDQFDWISSLDDSRFWPLPSTIEYGLNSLGKERWQPQSYDDFDEEASEAKMKKEMEKWGAKTIGEMYDKIEDHEKRQPKEPEWLHWQQVFINTLQEYFPTTPHIVWKESEKGSEPRLEDGSDLLTIDNNLYKARKMYLLELVDYLDKQGIVIPDEVFAGELWNVEEERPLMQMVKLKSEQTQTPLPPHAKQLYSREEDIKEIFDNYDKSRSSSAWLTICLSSDGAALVPTLMHRNVEWEPDYEILDFYAIDSPRALLEMHRNTAEIGIAWPSPMPLIKRFRELIIDGTIEQEWQRTVDFLKHHPLSKRYEQDQQIRALLKPASQSPSKETIDEN